jgi:hypothetical protein
MKFFCDLFILCGIYQIDADRRVRVNFIAELRPMFHGHYELVLCDGQTLSLSRRYKALLPAAIRERL